MKCVNVFKFNYVLEFWFVIVDLNYCKDNFEKIRFYNVIRLVIFLILIYVVY